MKEIDFILGIKKITKIRLLWRCVLERVLVRQMRSSSERCYCRHTDGVVLNTGDSRGNERGSKKETI